MNDRDAALVATVKPSAYAAIVAGQNGGTRVGLVELPKRQQETKP